MTRTVGTILILSGLLAGCVAPTVEVSEEARADLGKIGIIAVESHPLIITPSNKRQSEAMAAYLAGLEATAEGGQEQAQLGQQSPALAASPFLMAPDPTLQAGAMIGTTIAIMGLFGEAMEAGKAAPHLLQLPKSPRIALFRTS